ncbi:ATP-binding protein [Geomonas sp.]|uniref:ATP-binding protein n=1 Tax=Geomonas sp. TaxID=2651584 RepID=UPI002B46D41F|nr:ATP-binding protein [Geomonas sp.]HJV33429.1 ATP-binding protein [Geomonas sp.]
MAGRQGNNLLEQALRIAQASSRSPQARIAALLRLVARGHALSQASIFIPHPPLNALTQRFSTLLPTSSRDCLIPFGEGCVGRAAASRLPVDGCCHDLHPHEPTSAGDRSFRAYPVLDGKLLVAVCSVATTADTLPEEVSPLLGELGPILTLVLGELASAEHANQLGRNLEIVTALGRLVEGPIAAEALLPKALKLLTTTGFARCAITRLSEDFGATLFQSCRPQARAALPRMLLSEPALSARALADEVTCREVGAPARFSFYALSTPMSCNGSALGTLTLFGGQDLLAPEQVQLAETVARLLSCAVSAAASSRLLKGYSTDHDKKLKEISLLYRMSNTMLSTLKLNKLIHLTLTALTSGPTPFFDRAMLFLVNERSGSLVGMLGVTTETSPSLPLPQGGSDDLLSSRWDISEEEMAAQRESDFCRQVMGKRLELDRSLNIASQAVIEKRLIHIPAEQGSDPLHPGYGAALAASPLLAHGQTVGVVLVDNALTKSAMTQEQLRFLQLFANQAGMAIENSMLYNQIEETNRQLSEAQENLLQKERLAAIGEMAAGIAHELKGPLVSIGGFAGRLSRKLAQESDEWGHADLIVREVQRLENILSEILLFSKKATICYTRCNIADIVKDSLAVVTPPLEEKQIEVSTRFPRSKLLLLGDPQQLKQVFINLFLNALDAMGSGGKLTVQVGHTELEGREAACVKIADTGGGIPLESLASIFTPFYSTKESGTGLGLPIANRIVTNHGGKIQISNNPGQGAEFRVLLPKHW